MDSTGPQSGMPRASSAAACLEVGTMMQDRSGEAVMPRSRGLERRSRKCLCAKYLMVDDLPKMPREASLPRARSMPRECLVPRPIEAMPRDRGDEAGIDSIEAMMPQARCLVR